MDGQTVTASVVSSMVAGVVFHPLDTMLTVHQTNPKSSLIMPFRRYWSGLVPSVVFSVPAHTIDIVVYREAKTLLLPYLGSGSVLNYLCSSAMSQFVSALVWNPMDIIKGRMQIGDPVPMRSVMKQIYRQEGMRGFYRGFWLGMSIYMPYNLVWWTTYEEGKRLARNYRQNIDLTPLDYFLTSAAATTLGETASNFFVIVKKRTQLATSKELSALRPDDAKGILHVVRNLIKEAGIAKAFTRGLHIRLLSSVPGHALAMAIMEMIAPDRVS